MRNATSAIICIPLFILCNVATGQNSRLTLPPIFSDQMILQAGKPVSVWGKAAAKASVNVSTGMQTVTTLSDSIGNWSLQLSPMDASFTPRVLTVSSDSQSISFHDVLVGEVWLCSGQSNMVMSLGTITDPFFGVDSGKEEINEPVNNGIRVYNDNNLEDFNLKLRVWQRADSGAKAAFSAVAWFFGKKLQQQLNVPIGLINISAGGSPIQEWMTTASAGTDTLITRYHQIYQAHKTEIENYAQKAFEYWKYGNTNKDLRPPVALPPPIMLAGRFGKPGGLFNRMLSPVIPFSIRGFIWYQGESNADYVADAGYYDHLLKMMVNDWRIAWKEEQLPFYIVQLPCWNSGRYWPLLKLRQFQASSSIPHSGVVATSDICDSTDLHPREKKPVGERLARLALAATYGKNVVYKGPSVMGIHVKDHALHITFNTNGTTNVLTTPGSWNDVEMAGSDEIYYPARASLTNNIAFVESDHVSAPCYIRYGWRKTYTPTLFNTDGLPAQAFIYKITHKKHIELKAKENDITFLDNQ